MADYADLVLVDGEVLTVDAGFSVAEAVAVSGGVIKAVGSSAEIRALVGPGTRVVELGGRTVLPGINDSHVHACAFGVSLPPLALDVGFPAVRSVADVVAAVKEAAGQAPSGGWIRGSGWDSGYLAEGESFSRYDLDPASPSHPVCLQDFSGHASWINTRALELAGITRDTVAPEGGVIEVDHTGEPTGILREGAQHLVQRLLPPYTASDREQAIRNAVSILHSEGITSFTEPGLGPGGESLFGGSMGAQTLDVYADLARRGELAARVNVLLLFTGMTGSAAEVAEGLRSYTPSASVDPRFLNIIGVKVFADGIPPNKTAWMGQPYRGGGYGCLCVQGSSDAERTGQLAEMVRLAHAAGYQLGVHITGDRGIEAVTEAFAAAQAAHPRSDPRHYLIHADFPSAEVLATLASHGFGANMNPAVKWTIADLMEEMLGPERSAYQWPMRSAIDAGVTVCASSDAPVTYPNWRQGISAMMLRESKATGRVSGPEQRVTLAEAVRAYTINAAWQDFAESWKGSLEAGKVADITVLDGTLTTQDPHTLPETPVALTVLDGNVVHER